MSTPRTATLSSRSLAAITAAARTMYPHDGLPDDVYARVADKLAVAAGEDPATAGMIEDAVAQLDLGGRSGDEQLAALRAVEGSEFFELLRSTAVVEVYSDERTWRLCGYEGPSFEQGGYLHRGFDDLDWLPDPETAA